MIVSKKCEHCNNDFSGERWYVKKKRFCSKSCSSLVNMNKPEVREKVFNKLHSSAAKTKHRAAHKTDEYRSLRSTIAKKNGQKQSVKQAARKTMYKLHERIHNDPKWKLATSRRSSKLVLDPDNKFGASGRYRGNYAEYKSTGIFMRSSWEQYFAQLLDGVNIKWEYEPKTFKFNWTTYTPDFSVGSKLIEIRPVKFVNARLNKLRKVMKRKEIDYKILTSKKQMSEFVSNIGGL